MLLRNRLEYFAARAATQKAAPPEGGVGYDGNPAVAGRRVMLASCRRAASQYWQLSGGPFGAWLVNSLASLCLADPGDRAVGGTGLVLGECQQADPGISWRVS